MRTLPLYLCLSAAALVSSGAMAQKSSAAEKTMNWGLVPRDMVAFFMTKSCPAGWRTAPELRGTYLVAFDEGDKRGLPPTGTPLQPGENRPTGKHTHVGDIAFVGGDCAGPDACVAWSKTGAKRTHIKMTSTDAPGVEIKEGTPAPYVGLLACVKR